MTSVARRANHYDAMRIVLALAVLLAHSYELVDGNRDREPLTRLFGAFSLGDAAVYAFFLLSGRLVMESWICESLVTRFLWKRVRRIYPGFLAVTAFCAFVVGPLAADPSRYWAELEPMRLLTSSLLLKVPAIPDVFAGLPYPQVNGALWTIEHEFKCYLALAVLGLVGVVRRRAIWLALALGMVSLDLVWRLEAFDSVLAELRTIGSIRMLVELRMFFFVGAVYALYADVIVYRLRYAALAFGLLLAGMFSRELAHPAFAIAGSYVFFYVGQCSARGAQEAPRFPDLSYGLYLYGWPLQKLVIWYVPGIAPLAVFTLVAAASFAFAAGSWYGIERPALLRSIAIREPAKDRAIAAELCGVVPSIQELKCPPT
jgi:peptidoglycan/LPS O-acetylase OafA/YrhL